MFKHIILILAFLGCVSVSSAQKAVRALTLNDAIASGTYYARTISGLESMNDGEHYTSIVANNIIKYSYKTGLPVDTLLSKASLQKYYIESIESYAFNSDESRILFLADKEPIYRHSFVANYYVYELATGKLTPVSSNGKQQMASFSPVGNKVAFVRNNNIFISDMEKNVEYQVTTDGKRNEIINGMPDWVYEEEFALTKGYEWSPNGKSIGYLRFDESEVKEYTIPMYDSLYPTPYTYKYPKAGEKNSKVTVWVYNLDSRQNKQMDTGKETDQYIPRIKWTSNPNQLGIVRLNRLQNHVEVLNANAASGQTKVIFDETNKYFISEVSDHFISFLPQEKGFVVFSERDGYAHLYLYDMSGKLIRQLTKGNFDVKDLNGIDATKGLIYYTSTEVSPMERDVYAVSIDGAKKQKISVRKGTNEIEFSRNFKYYILTWSDANTPFKVTLHDISGKAIRTLEDNSRLEGNLGNFFKTKKEFISIPTANGILLNAYIIKPHDFDSTRKYPLINYVYGGPEVQEVTNGWDNGAGWQHMLAQMGYIVVCADNRGSDGGGEAFRKATYMQLGKYEAEDQLNVARYMSGLSYIDGLRIGMFGWSYGGYMTTLCLTKGNGLLKVGVAVAPVTNWRFYDTVYTERFMRAPQENPHGYDDNSPLNFANDLKGKLLIIHGSADDNVHVQNTMMFTAKLVQANKDFEMAIYTDKNHSIYGGYTRLQLYRKVTDFFVKNL
ncbi:MAG TPA: S9 family peptidase [Bacteroidales bacterium]|nr:S9 family peptidase [Bacteroidales bacterium]